MKRRSFLSICLKLSVSATALSSVFLKAMAKGNNKKFVFSSIEQLKSGVAIESISIVDELKRLVVEKDLIGKTLSYHNNDISSASKTGSATYIISTLERIRISTGSTSWVPDGYGEHYIFDGTTYVAVLSKTVPVTPQMFGASVNRDDNNNELQAFANWLPNYPFCKSDESGTMLATHVVFPPLTNFNLDFSGLVFKVKDGHDPLDNELIRFDSLQNGVVTNFETNGNKNNVIDVDNCISSFGRILNWRLGNYSTNVTFNGLGMYDALYCGSQWGHNISNILLLNVHYDQIGEHVFYISGLGGGNNRNIHWRGVVGGSFGLNLNNAVNNIKHDTHFIKSAQTIGDNDNWSLRDAVFTQVQNAAYAANIVSNGDLNTLYLKNIKVGMNIDAILYPVGNAYNVKIDGIKQINTLENGKGTRLIYSKISELRMKKWEAKNLQLSNVYSHTNIGMFDCIEDSILGRCDTSALQPNEYENDSRKIVFKNVTFMNTPVFSHVEHDFVLKSCIFSEKSFRCLANIGGTINRQGKWVNILDCVAPSSFTSPITVANENCNLRIKNFTDYDDKGLSPLNMDSRINRINRLEVDGYKCRNTTDNPLGNVIANYYDLNHIISQDGHRNWLHYHGILEIPQGSTSISYDLSNRLARAPTRKEISIKPQANLNKESFIGYQFDISGFIVTVYTDTAVTAPYIVFDVKVELLRKMVN